MNPARTGEIHALIRSPYTGDVVLPGSSFKGAIRTALVSALIQRMPEELGRLKRDIEDLIDQGKKRLSVPVEETALGYQRNKTEQDPLRLLEVADCSWPGSETRIDQGQLSKLGRQDSATSEMGLYLERLPSQADGESPPECRLRMKFNTSMLANQRVQKLIHRPLTLDWIEQACNWFYQDRFGAEWERFRELFNNRRPWQYPLENGRLPSGSVLVRVGRHCHFDSLSVDGLRHGWNARTHDWMPDIGSTRTLCWLADGGVAPFGWVLLQRVA